MDWEPVTKPRGLRRGQVGLVATDRALSPPGGGSPSGEDWAPRGRKDGVRLYPRGYSPLDNLPLAKEERSLGNREPIWKWARNKRTGSATVGGLPINL